MKLFFTNPSLWWKFEGKFYLRDFRIGIRNLIKWLPVIWKDRDWDSYYIYKIIEHKLKLQSDSIGKRDIHVNAKRDAEVMKTCVNLIQKITDSFYELEYTDYYKCDYWFEDINDKPGYSTMEHEIQGEWFDEYFTKYPLIYKRVLSGEGVFDINKNDLKSERKKTIAMNIAHINQDRARTLLFKILSENIEGWWD